MNALPVPPPAASQPENISNLLTLDQEHPAPPIVANHVSQKDWLGECARARKYPEKFWSDYAKSFTWSRPWDRVLDWDGIHHKWFTGAKTNITLNALDRHANSDHRNRAAFIWLGEDGSGRIVTYGQLHRMVCRFANGLKSPGRSQRRPRNHLHAAHHWQNPLRKNPPPLPQSQRSRRRRRRRFHHGELVDCGTKVVSGRFERARLQPCRLGAKNHPGLSP